MRWKILGVAPVVLLVGAVLVACRPVVPPTTPPPTTAPPPPSPMSLGWHDPGVDGPIAVDSANNLLWAMNKGANKLDALNPSTGAVVNSATVTLNGAQHFPTPDVSGSTVVIEEGSGVAAFSTPSEAVLWTSPALDGIIQARPLIVGSIVVVATENNSLYGLNLADGTIAWFKLGVLGFPETATHIHSFGPNGCGDVFPLGITSNPVFDASSGDVYAVGEVQTGTTSNADPPDYKLIGVDPATGTVKFTPTVIDPLSMTDTPFEQQRAGLAAANGNIYVGFGGLDGDCSTYHGYVVSASDTTGSIVGDLEVSATTNAGAVWGTSGPVVDSAGNVYASTGNDTNLPPANQTDYSDAVVKVPSTMSTEITVPPDYFQPAEWRSDNSSDLDLGSAGPVLLPNGTQLFIIGKQHNAFLLNLSSLGGGDHLTPAARLDNACSGQAFGQNAVLGGSAYVACTTGMQQVILP
jgi:hypothetical protein